MKLGLESESMHLWLQNGYMDILEFIDFAHELGFDGVLINIIKDYGLDPEWGALGSDNPTHLEKIAQKLKDYKMFCEIDSKGFDIEKFKKIIKVCEALDAKIVRSYVPLTNKQKKDELQRAKSTLASAGAYDDSKIHASFDVSEFYNSASEIKALIPLLEKHDLKLALENHEYQTSTEIVELIKRVGHKRVGALFDFGNSMMCYEEPLKACKDIAPFTFSTHCKDHIVFIEESTPYVCGVPLGEGNIDIKSCLKVLLDSGLKTINLEVCFPYCATFKREIGTGGVTKLGEGSFKLEKPLFPYLKALEYYYPQSVKKEYLEKLLVTQKEGVIKSMKHLQKLLGELYEA
ncbi:sugar phosphate isomerase [Helicobacter sp. 11S02629-2]|nr:sugar phosphate isomerase [Helicobacter sp. 11S02629-2]